VFGGWFLLVFKHLLHTPPTVFVGIFIGADLRFYQNPTGLSSGYY